VRATSWIAHEGDAVTRIIGGQAGGRRLETPSGQQTRPTSDRVREALFSALEAAQGPLAGVRFLDLYAGSGAVGLEAWSRGAGAVTLVESDRRTAQLVRRNATAVGFPGAEVLAVQVRDALRRPPASAYDVVFIDPPYALSEEDVASDLVALATGGWLAPDALVVIERSSRSPEPRWPSALTRERSRAYGETVLWYGRADRAAVSASDAPDPKRPSRTDPDPNEPEES
jgi:16S rRNA (guanine966-N2)-methyltransferase